MNIIFANIGWMTYYRGNNTKDQIVGGGSYRNEDKHEAFNFLPIKGNCYGYVQPVKWGAIQLNRIDEKCCNVDKINNVLVIWMATHPKNGGTYIVGWYKNATVFNKFQESKSKLRKYYTYNFKAKAENCVLIPLDQRIFQVPRANVKGKGFLGQSNVWYADSKELPVQLFRNKVLEYINDYHNASVSVSKQVIKINVEARKQVELAAVKFVTEEYERFGYKVISREKENIGWDLDAIKNSVKLKLEVKGLAQSQISVRISYNEYKSMMENTDYYRLCVVTNAIKKPVLTVFIWDNNLERWVSDKDPSLILNIEEKPSYLAEV